MTTYYHELVSAPWRTAEMALHTKRDVSFEKLMVTMIDECRALRERMLVQRSNDGRIVSITSVTFAFSDEDRCWFDYTYVGLT